MTDARGVTNLFISGFPSTITEEQVRALVGQYGAVMSVKVLPPGNQGDCACLVRMGNETEASFMLNNLNGNILHGMTTPITVRVATSGKGGKGGGQGPGIGLKIEPNSVAVPSTTPPMAQPFGGPQDNLFVGGLPKGVSTEDLRAFFCAYGFVMDCKVLPDNAGDRSDVAGLVRMSCYEEAKRIIDLFNGAIPEGGKTPLAIRFAQNAPKGYIPSCNHFQRGTCSYGANCRFAHRPKDDASGGVQPTAGMPGMGGMQSIGLMQGYPGVQSMAFMQGMGGMNGMSGIQGMGGMHGLGGGVTGMPSIPMMDGMQGLAGMQSMGAIQGVSSGGGMASTMMAMNGIQGLNGVQGITGAAMGAAHLPVPSLTDAPASSGGASSEQQPVVGASPGAVPAVDPPPGVAAAIPVAEPSHPGVDGVGRRGVVVDASASPYGPAKGAEASVRSSPY